MSAVSLARRASLLALSEPPKSASDARGCHAHVRPRSMHESCLQHGLGAAAPEMRSVCLVQNALEQDTLLLKCKYAGGEPCIDNARFHVDLPVGPQNMKFSEKALEAGSPRSRPATSEKRFNIQTLREVFNEMDEKKMGEVSRTQVRQALRQRNGRLQWFFQGAGFGFDSNGNYSVGLIEARLVAIFNEIDANGNGVLEWHEFLRFFKDAGCFLEYKTRLSLNACSDPTATAD